MSSWSNLGTTFHSLLTMSRSPSPPGTPPHQGIPDPPKCPPAPRRRIPTIEHWLGRIPEDSLTLREYFLSLGDPMDATREQSLDPSKSADAKKSSDMRIKLEAIRIDNESAKLQTKE